MRAGADFSGSERFELRRQLGAGGMGVVYQAYDRERDGLVALKTMTQVDAASLYRFKREFRALADLAHPNLVTLHELFFRDDQWFFTMELVEGKGFVEYARAANDAREHEARLVRSLRQLVDGVGALHAAGHLHRDIKPSNVLVTEEGRVVLLDFGLVTPLAGFGGGYHSTTPRVLGTIAYMAPEQGSGRPLSEASDWYSVGLMLYEALTGRIPFVEPELLPETLSARERVVQTLEDSQADTQQPATPAVPAQQPNWIRVLSARLDSEPPPPQQLRPDVPAALNDICVGLLRVQPESRLTRAQILERLGDAEAGAVSLDAAPSVPFVGRADHLQSLQAAFEVVRRGRAVTVYVHGSSGIGKTALARRFLDGLLERDRAVVLEGRCYEQESVPYKALDSIIDALSHYLACLKRAQAAELLPRDTWALARAFPVLSRVDLIAEWPQRPLEQADPLALRRRAFQALRELLARAGDRRPLVLFVDDLQWGDVDSAQLLAELTRPPDAPVMMLLACYRSEDASTSPLLRELRRPLGASAGNDVRDLELQGLSPDDARALAVALLREEASADVRRDSELIVRESKGHPLFVHELAQQASKRTPASRREPAHAELSLDQVVRSRLQRLAPPARRLLEMLALAGQPMRQSVAHKAAALLAGEQDVIRSLRNGHLVRVSQLDGQPCLETFHDRIRETVCAQLSPSERREGHRRLARALEDSPRADPEALAFHFGEAGEARLAYRYARVAADRAAEAFAFDRAAMLYRRCLELQSDGDTDADGCGLLTRAGEALANAGRGAEAARSYLDAAARAAPSLALELQRRAAEQYLASGLLDEGLGVTRTVLLAAGLRLPETPRRALPSLLLRRGFLRLRGLRFRERDSSQIAPRELARIDVCRTVAQGLSLTDHIRGADFQTRHLLLALRAGEPYRLAIALALETSYCATPGGPARRRSEQLMKTTMELAERVGSPHAIGLATFTRGLSDYLVGRWKSCFEQCERATKLLQEHCVGVVWELASAQRFSLAALAYLGGVEEIRRRADLLLEEAQQRGNLYAATHLLTRYGHLTWLAADDPDQGSRQVEEAMARWTQTGFHLQHYSGLMARSQCDLYRKDASTAYERITRAWPELQASLLLRVQALRLEAIHLRARCELAASLARAGDAQLLASAERAASRIERERMPWSDPLAWLLRAAVAAARGQRPESLELLSRAAGAFEAADMALYAAAARRRKGELLGESGRAEVEASDAWMLAHGVKAPSRMTGLLAPGFP